MDNANLASDFFCTFISKVYDPFYKSLAVTQHYFNVLTHKFWDELKVRSINLPITTGSISSPIGLGSDSLPVSVKIGKINTYLADSMQFALEYGCRFHKNGCYYIMPSFRGEDVDKTHLSQFFHSEAEMPVGFSEIMEVVNEYVKFLCAGLLENKDDIGKNFIKYKKIEKILSVPFKSVSFREAMHLLRSEEDCFREVAPNAYSITRKGEKELLSKVGPVVWLYDLDYMSVPFYQASNEDGVSAKAADLLMEGVGEVAGCGERHRDGKSVRNSLKKHCVKESEYEWYIQMKDEVSLKTSGFGMGIERFFMFLTEVDDIRNLQILPRDNNIEYLP